MAGREVVRVVRGEWDTECPHDCWTGMEGPANTLPEDVPGQSRWPLLWVCGCGTLGVTTDKGTVPVRARVLLDPDLAEAGRQEADGRPD